MRTHEHEDKSYKLYLCRFGDMAHDDSASEGLDTICHLDLLPCTARTALSSDPRIIAQVLIWQSVSQVGSLRCANDC
jgi:hypothetical protein